MVSSCRHAAVHIAIFWIAACAATESIPSDGPAGNGGSAGSASAPAGGVGAGGNGGSTTLADGCARECAADGSAVVDCDGQPVLQCGSKQACAPDWTCANACEVAAKRKASVGCEYYTVMMDILPANWDSCFAAFVANTFREPAALEVTYDGQLIDLGTYAKVPKGSGKSLVYDAYDPAAGLAPGEVAILFLGNAPGGPFGVQCPSPAAIADAQVHGTGRGKAFRIRSDVPVVAYQMLPFGGGSSAVTGATLLLPTSVWDGNYVAVNAYSYIPMNDTSPSLDIVAAENGTTVQILPRAPIEGGNGVAGAPANTPTSYELDAGEVLQITQQAELTGSPISANKPVGVFGGHECINVPASVGTCDHAEQQIAPVRALGHEYIAVSHRQRTTLLEQTRWRIIGVADGTKLSYEPAVGGPASLALGDVVEWVTNEPFVVRSQDAQHPFMLFTYMTGQGLVGGHAGDPDFVRIMPSAQYLSRYVFFTDPTYPETNLVVVRERSESGDFADVTLDCAGTLGGWQPVGAGGNYEFTRFDLVRHDFEPQSTPLGWCDNGRREMSSSAPFGLWVWGWGSVETSTPTNAVSYGYPAGENVIPINDLYVPPVPK